MKIVGIQPTTLIDYPGEIASTIFLPGCNFRCDYCFNKTVVYGTGTISVEECLSFLTKRKHVIEHVVITGGEPTINDGLIGFMSKIKDAGFKIKLDTNGYSPHAIQSILKVSGLVDYIAMDIKAGPAGYSRVAGIDIDTKTIEHSITLISESNVGHEFRTTVFKEVHNAGEIDGMLCWIRKKVRRLYIQNSISYEALSIAELRDIQALGNKYFIDIVIRGLYDK